LSEFIGKQSLSTVPCMALICPEVFSMIARKLGMWQSWIIYFVELERRFQGSTLLICTLECGKQLLVGMLRYHPTFSF
jgi:hypothetical protein